MAEFPAGTDFLPGTNQPVPEIMTREEACCYLRIDVGREMKNAIKALNRLVDRKLIRPCMYLKKRHYKRDELDRFLTEQTEIYGKVG